MWAQGDRGARTPKERVQWLQPERAVSGHLGSLLPSGSDISWSLSLNPGPVLQPAGETMLLPTVCLGFPTAATRITLPPLRLETLLQELPLSSLPRGRGPSPPRAFQAKELEMFS